MNKKKTGLLFIGFICTCMLVACGSNKVKEAESSVIKGDGYTINLTPINQPTDHYNEVKSLLDNTSWSTEDGTYTVEFKTLNDNFKVIGNTDEPLDGIVEDCLYTSEIQNNGSEYEMIISINSGIDLEEAIQLTIDDNTMTFYWGKEYSLIRQ